MLEPIEYVSLHMNPFRLEITANILQLQVDPNEELGDSVEGAAVQVEGPGRFRKNEAPNSEIPKSTVEVNLALLHADDWIKLDW